MVINANLLLSSGAELVRYEMNKVIFNEGDISRYYFQIKSGTVKINSYNEDGKELIHSLPFDGHCFAETFLFTDKKYPINAIAITDCYILRFEKNRFLQFITRYPELLTELYAYTAERMYYRHVMLNTLSTHDPYIKIMNVMRNIKSYNNHTVKFSYQFPYTRKQLAALTGLRVETVIRVIKKMEKEEIVKIENRKIFY